MESGRPRGDLLLSENAAGIELKRLYELGQRAAKVGGKLKNVGMSHVASYRFSKDRKTVESVSEVYSVDLVIRPATTKTLFEGTQNMDEAQLAELSKVRAERDQAQADLKAVKAELEALKPQHEKLQAEHKQATKELDDLKAEKAVGERKASIEAALKTANLDPNDKAVCSERFLADLVAQADPTIRSEMIADRAALVAKAKESKPTSTERQQEGVKEFDPAKALEKLLKF